MFCSGPAWGTLSRRRVVAGDDDKLAGDLVARVGPIVGDRIQILAVQRRVLVASVEAVVGQRHRARRENAAPMASSADSYVSVTARPVRRRGTPSKTGLREAMGQHVAGTEMEETSGTLPRRRGQSVIGKISAQPQFGRGHPHTAAAARPPGFELPAHFHQCGHRIGHVHQAEGRINARVETVRH